MRASRLFFQAAAPALVGTLIFSACSRGPLPVTPLKSSDLPATSFDIRADRDTTLRTPAGATLRISAGTLQPQSGITGRIVVREAYTMGQMLRGGLVTMSGSDILSSGGMISIEPGEGTKRELAKAIRVSIPTNERRGGMQLWSGKQDTSSGRVDWQDPISLNSDSVAFRSGRILFNQNCSSCHNPKRDATGPAMGDMLQTYDFEWLAAFTRNPTRMIADGDILANASFCKYGTVMTAFPNLSDSELHAIFTYAEMAAGPSTTPRKNLRASVDSCKAYLRKNGISLDSRPSSSGPSTDESPVPAATKAADLVVVAGSGASYYEISVRSFGWYNVDALLKDMDGFENSNVLAKFSGARKDGISVYLLMPEDNILLEGGPATGGAGSYAFYRNDGTVPLRIGSRGIAVGVKDSAGHWFFAMKEFKAVPSQEIALELQPIEKDSLNGILDRMIGSRDRTQPAQPSLDALNDPKLPADALRPKNIACGCK